MSESQNIAALDRFVEEVINQGKYDVCDEIVEENFVELDPLPGQQQGREGLKDVIRMLRTGFPDIHWVVEETIASGEKVVSRFKWTGTHHGEFLGIPASGRKVVVPGVVIDRLQNGKMADSRILMDTMGMMQQLGMIPGRVVLVSNSRDHSATGVPMTEKFACCCGESAASSCSMSSSKRL